jgi:ribonuclease HII
MYMSGKVDARLIPKRPNLKYESALWKQKLVYVAGLDEAGRGALAGPVCAGAVVLPNNYGVFRKLKGVRDSKEMTARARDHWAERIKNIAVGWGMGWASAKEIDHLGIVPATKMAMMRALVNMRALKKLEVEHLLVDALILPDVAIGQTKLLKGDQRSLSIAAASVLAKVGRDLEMRAMEKLYPGYGFGQHKGYGTLRHRQQIMERGVTAIHRTSFRLLGEGP